MVAIDTDVVGAAVASNGAAHDSEMLQEDVSS